MCEAVPLLQLFPRRPQSLHHCGGSQLLSLHWAFRSTHTNLKLFSTWTSSVVPQGKCPEQKKKSHISNDKYTANRTRKGGWVKPRLFSSSQGTSSALDPPTWEKCTDYTWNLFLKSTHNRKIFKNCTFLLLKTKHKLIPCDVLPITYSKG